MPYTQNTWAVGDTITAAKLNNIETGITEAAQSGGGGWDAIIRLTHAENSGYDTAENITPSIVEGTYADLVAKMQDGGCPCILVEYVHPNWGKRYAAPMAFAQYYTQSEINIAIAGYFANVPNATSPFNYIGALYWTSSDTIAWG
ncbi:MAG: hypothetical protein K5859_03445 [Atopobiaceae bacterium]|nr:hypothetical protein [Atopobiaceae bacterium]